MRRGFTIVELLVATALVATCIGLAVWLFGYGGHATRTVTGRLAAQQSGRRALVAFLAEIQEGMDVVSPRPGTTLSYALVRDKVAQFRLYYQVPETPGGSTYALWRYVEDPQLDPARRRELLLGGIRRLTFTSRSEGVLDVNLELEEEDQVYAMVTAVRLRNIASTEELW